MADIDLKIVGSYPKGCFSESQAISLDIATDLLLKRLIESGQDVITLSRESQLQIVWDVCRCFNAEGFPEEED